MNKMIIIGAAAAVLVAGGGGAYYFLAGGDTEAEAAEIEVEVEEPAGVLELDTFLTNLKDPAGKHHARVQIQLAITPDTAIAEIEASPIVLIRVRDQVLSLINSKTPMELGSAEGKETFRGEIANSLAPLITQGKIKEVFFSDFVVK